MKHATYIGNDPVLDCLDDKGALVRPAEAPGKVLAQFDSLQAYCSKTAATLGVGWHEFDEADFVEDPEVEDDQ